jgi:hypothetical protein
MLYLSGVVRPDLPAMITPDMYQAPPPGQLWAADTGCYTRPERYTDARYLAWLRKHAGDLERCIFATAPDVVGDMERTLDIAVPMLGQIRALGYPAALVCQPTTTTDMVPWELVDALFLGGPDAWKHGEDAYRLCRAARARGVWLHMGRVNGAGRMDLARSFGCDSVDGTVLRFDPSRPVARWVAHAATRPMLWEHEP